MVTQNALFRVPGTLTSIISQAAGPDGQSLTSEVFTDVAIVFTWPFTLDH